MRKESDASGGGGRASGFLQTGSFGALALLLLSLSLSALFHVSGVAQPADFGPVATYSIGGTAYNVEAADLDGLNGRDLVASSHAADGFSVLINNGDGTFGAATTYEIANAIRGLAIGDFDGDGIPDVVVAARLQELYMVPGLGDGTFGATQVSVQDNFGGNLYDLAAADFDGDANLDVAAISSFNVVIFSGDGEGGFAVTDVFDATDSFVQHAGLVAADLNGDGWVDVAAGTGDSQVVIALNDGTGDLTETSRIDSRSDAYDVTAADFDGDGDLDLGVSGFNVALLTNDGTGTFADGGIVINSGIAWSLSAADVNLDGNIDLIPVAASQGVQPLYGDGAGGFEAGSTVAMSLGNAYGIVTEDLDGDSKPDVAATDTAVLEGLLSVRLNTTAPTVEPERPTAKIISPDPAPNEAFGWSIYEDSGRLAIGGPEPGIEPGSAGHVHMFTKQADEWVPAYTITPADGVTGDDFGSAVAIIGDLIFVGARDHDAAGLDEGAVYVYRDEGSGATQLQKLLPPEPASSSSFGRDIDVDAVNGRLIVGGHFWDAAKGSDAGAAYVYRVDGNSVALEAVLTEIVQPLDYFGTAVALDGEYAFVGAWRIDNQRGRVWVYERDAGGSWSRLQELRASDASDLARFGVAVDVRGTTAVIGAHIEGAGFQGAAYVFELEGGLWVERQKLKAPDAADDEWFGHPVAVTSGRILVSALRESEGTVTQGGAVYVYEPDESSNSWMSALKVVPSDRDSGDWFGDALHAQPTRFFAGAQRHDAASMVDAGAVYEFVFDTPVPDGLTVIWTGDGDGLGWEDAANWSPARVPTPQDTVIIRRSGAEVLASGDYTVGALELGGQANISLSVKGSLNVTEHCLIGFSATYMGGPLAIGGLLTWENGRMTGADTTYANGGLLITNDAGSNTNRILDGRALVLSAGERGVHEGDRLFGSNGGQLIIENGAVYEIVSAAGFELSGAGVMPAVVNRGTFLKGTSSSLSEIDWDFVNAGNLEVRQDGAELRLDADFRDEDGSYLATAGQLSIGTLGDTVIFGPATVVQGSGTVEFSRGTFTIQGEYNVSGSTRISDNTQGADVTIVSSANLVDLGGLALRVLPRGTLQVQTSEPLRVGSLALTAGTLRLAAPLTVLGDYSHELFPAAIESDFDINVSGFLRWRGGQMRGAGTTFANGGLSIFGGTAASDRKILDSRRLVIPENTEATFTGFSVVEGLNGAVLEIEPDAVFEIQGHGDLEATGRIPPRIENLGRFGKTGDGLPSRISFDFINSGVLDFSNSVVEMGGELVSDIGAVITGTDTLDVTGAASVTNNGTVAPGRPAAAGVPGESNIGRLTIAGSYSNAILEIEVSGPVPAEEHDVLSVNGTALLGGTLDLRFVNGFVPVAGQSFAIVEAESVTGVFERVEVTGLSSLEANVVYSAANVTVEITEVSETGLARSPWPMYGRDVRHTGRSALTGPSTEPQVVWAFADGRDGALSRNTPVLGEDGTIFVGGFDEFLALNPNGTLKWSVPLPTASPAAVARDGTVYVGSFDTNPFTALAPDGSVKWTLSPGDNVLTPPAITDDGTVFFGSNTGLLYAVNPDGSVEWIFETGGIIQSGPAIAPDGTIHFASFDGNLYAVNPDGTLKWSFGIGTDSQEAPAVANDGTVYVGNFESGKLYAVSAEGRLRWDVDLPGGGFSPSIGEDGTIYTGSAEGVHAISPSGRILWNFPTGEVVRRQPVIDAQGNLFFGDSAGRLFALSPDATPIWMMEVGEIIQSAVVIDADGRLIVSSLNGVLALEGVPAPAISLTPDSVDFGDVVVGTEATANVELENSGSAGLNVSGLSIQDTETAFSIDVSPPFTLEPNESVTITVAFAPSTDGDQATTMLIESNAGSTTVALSGRGVSTANRAPVAVDDQVQTQEDVSLFIRLLANDSDPDGDALRIVEVNDASNGTISMGGDSTVTYTPDENFNGEDTFTYRASDGEANSNTATVTITVTPVNDAPVAVDDVVSTARGTPLAISVLDNDTDVDGDDLAVLTVDTPSAQGGRVTLLDDGRIEYSPAQDFSGTDSFGYEVSDPGGLKDRATVTVTVEELLFSIVDLHPAAGLSSVATAINDNGAVTGSYRKQDGSIGAFVWDGAHADLNVPNALHALAHDVNADGVVVGFGMRSDSTGFAFVAGPEVEPRQLEGPEAPIATAYALNAGGQIVGSAGFPPHAVLWEGSSFSDLHAFSTDASEAFDINDRNAVVGVAYGSNGLAFPFLGDRQLGSAAGRAFGVSSTGLVAGSQEQNNVSVATVWSADGVATSIGPSGRFSEAYAVSAAGWVVGTSELPPAQKTDGEYDPNPTNRVVRALSAGHTKTSRQGLTAFLVIQNDLKHLEQTSAGGGWELIEARDVNAAGQIVGYGILDGRVRAFLLQPADNLPPKAQLDEIAVGRNGEAVIDVLANDTDQDGDPIRIIHVEPAAWGTVMISDDSTAVHYTAPDFEVVDSFEYMISDGRGAAASGSASVVVSSISGALDRPILFQNYPNPFALSTTIRYRLPGEMHVRLEIYDLLGRQVRLLVDTRQKAGIQDVGVETGGLAGGIYFYRLEAADQVITRTLTINP